MTSMAKIATNRKNSQLSTGPRSLVGKTIVAQNAVRHGIFAHLPLVPGETIDEWQVHREGILASLAPVGLLEVTLTERAALLLWRLARLARYEANTITADIEDAGLLPNDVDISYAASLTYNRENLLKLTEQELRRARQDLASVAPHAHFLRRLRHDDGLDPLPLDVVQSVLNTAYSLVFEYPVRCYEPDHPNSSAFRVRMGFKTSAHDQCWTKGEFLKSLVYFAGAIDLTAADFRIELQDALEEDVHRFIRSIERLESDKDAQTRRIQDETMRLASSALLSQEKVTDRVIKYERHLHSLLTSTLHELERLQSRRAGKSVVPAIVADIQCHVSMTDD